MKWVERGESLSVASAWETRAAAAAGAESVRSRPQPCRVSEEVKHNVALWDP